MAWLWWLAGLMLLGFTGLETRKSSNTAITHRTQQEARDPGTRSFWERGLFTTLAAPEEQASN